MFPADRYGPVCQIRQRRLLDYLKRLHKKLGLPGRLHTFRHTFISLALTRGVPEAMVREWVGHVDDEMIQRQTGVARCNAASGRIGEIEAITGRLTGFKFSIFSAYRTETRSC